MPLMSPMHPMCPHAPHVPYAPSCTGFVYPACVPGGSKYGQGDTIRTELQLEGQGTGVGMHRMSPPSLSLSLFSSFSPSTMLSAHTRTHIRTHTHICNHTHTHTHGCQHVCLKDARVCRIRFPCMRCLEAHIKSWLMLACVEIEHAAEQIRVSL